MFRIEAIGNLGGDAEVRSENGRSYVQFSVADTRKFKTADGKEQEVTNWISCFFRNPESEVVKFLKKGTRVFVRGNGETRLFSSAKDRMMKAGVSINVQEIELVGGISDPVPRELALSSGQIVPVNKAFWIDINGMEPQPAVAYDRRGNPYMLGEHGFIISYPSQQQEQSQQSEQSQQPEQSQLPEQGLQKSKGIKQQQQYILNADGTKTEIF